MLVERFSSLFAKRAAERAGREMSLYDDDPRGARRVSWLVYRSLALSEVLRMTTLRNAQEGASNPRRVPMHRATASVTETCTLTQYARIPSDAANILLERIGSEARECFVVLPLSTRNQILAIDLIATGTVNSCLAIPADVYRRVLAHADAAACIVGHNHPSGDVTPSSEDRALTRAGAVLGIRLLDHVVVSSVVPAPLWWSFQEHGEL